MSFREERAVIRRNEILHTAARFFREKGYHATSIEEIAAEMKFTKASVYYYVPSKADLLYECNDLAMDLLLQKAELIMASDNSPEVKLKELIKQHVETLIDEISLLTVALQQEYGLEEKHRKLIVDKRDRYEQYFVTVMEEGVRAGIFVEHDTMMVKMIVFGALNWMFHWYSKCGRLKKMEIAEFFAEYLLQPLLKNSLANKRDWLTPSDDTDKDRN